jgi:N6-L-threonylcarbamoyladenine synthase
MLILGIESSCDETAVALVDGAREICGARILANLVKSQLAEHAPFGGVVPEIAARSHMAHIEALVRRALAESGRDFSDLSAIAATAGPGLIGGVFVGVMVAKSIALARNLPFLAINHLEGHALTARLTHDLDFPYLLLLVSGGHCQLLAVEGVGRYRRYGNTLDDALGEAFDKSAKLLGLGYPGGPALERLAEGGDPAAFDLPRPLLGRKQPDFSFSGLKTALRHRIAELGRGVGTGAGSGTGPGAGQGVGQGAGQGAGRNAAGGEDLPEGCKADLAASFQAAAGDVLADRCRVALALFAQDYGAQGPLVAAGGVAANRFLRARLERLCAAQGTRLVAPPPKLCTDNGAMIAWAGVERLRLGLQDPLDFAPRPRWPLEEMRGATPSREPARR